ncbi:unnamed protein product [Wuchereria bancrofti]|uniref:Uncharacterized protein n=1 Tax=Wuchereria bancrofti TaxID=6293 RepID=A0A3P7EQ71_WUCBA|nr:unnamed protein product [Wuchereria bancrofti]
MQVPQAEPHTVVQEQGNNNIGNSVWYLQQAVRNIKRVAYSRLENAQAGRIVKGCRWFLRLLSPGFTAAQKTAAVEHHALDWPMIISGTPHAARLLLPAPIFYAPLMEGSQEGYWIQKIKKR